MTRRIKVAPIGVGNCASSLLQGLAYYKNVKDGSSNLPGLMHPSLGGYLLGDIEIVAAFDVNADKIGKDVAEAIHVPPNNARKFAEAQKAGVVVSPGFIGDGIAPHLHGMFPLQEDPERVVEVLRESNAEMVVNFLPVGSQTATRFYAEACLAAGVAFINGIPEFIASDPKWAKRFEERGLPCAGDDVMSQVGATIVHRALTGLIRERGERVEQTYQLNVGGNMDFENLSDPARLTSKKISKTDAVAFETGNREVRAGPSGHVPFLHDRKVAYLNILGRQFGDVPFELRAELSVEDSPNCAGVIVDAIRLMKLSLDRGLVGYQAWSAYLFKHPLHLLPLPEARRVVEEFIAGK